MNNNEPKGPATRNLPWLIDIFLYPINTSGLINLGIFWLIPVVLEFIQMLLPIPFVYSIINLVIGLYMYYFVMDCIRDSAAGNIRAPENIANMPDLGDAFWQGMEIAASVIIFWGPAGFYHLFTNRTDAIFWSLLTWGVFFFPIGLLAVAMFNSTAAFNPLVWFASIFSTFFKYCGIVLFLCVLVHLFFMIVSFLGKSLLVGYFLRGIFIYLLMVLAHLLGRFYHLNREKLNWDV
jgi:hypothetical protein